ncbi:hypothetical protein LTR37_007310 [Vermiconidia calcicola]|uniref:Uncharacterized protein n=1 Tax=Vermiconidia calcicola TaxID=1690605 RepID=A0ACC3NDW5_9PEZI|nr:hypothetical protein LTR37_007310 [Vermiconidia calcicola]
MVKIIVGLMGSSVQLGSAKSTTTQLRSFLDMLKTHNIRELDTARVYNAGKSEEDLGSILEAKDDFAIATKAPGFMPGSLTYEKITSACNASLAALKQDKVDLYWFHGPDRQTPLEESCRAISDLHKQGKFDRFGVSNFRVDEVEEVHSICSQNNWILPTVYQGGYNPLTRLGEEKLFPTLGKLGIAFYGFSPLAGGYFSRPTSQLREPPATGSRMDEMKNFKSMYVNDVSLKLHEELSDVCEKHGVSLKAATLRWLVNHSVLGKEDGVIVGGSSEAQMEENLMACEDGPLPLEIVEAFESLYGRSKAGGMDLPYCV